jgi:hypothetical protein
VGGSYTCNNSLAGDRGPRENRERGGGHRLGRWWPSSVGRRLDPAGSGEGIWAGGGQDADARAKEDRLGQGGGGGGPRCRQPGKDGGQEARTVAERAGRWPGKDGDRAARWPGNDGGLQAGVGADGGGGALQAMMGDRRACGPVVAVARCRRRWAAGERAGRRQRHAGQWWRWRAGRRW